MIYLFNTSNTPWGYITMGEYYGKLTSNRMNKKTNKEELIGLAVSAKLPINIDDLGNYIDMENDCQLICDRNTVIKFRHKDLKPWVAETTSDKQYNTDVFLATIPLAGGVIKNIQGANVLGYKIINNEFIVYFTAKRKQNTEETPVITLANDKERTETDFVFERNENGVGYRVVTNYYNMKEEDGPTKPMKIIRYRHSSATKLIFVHEEDIDVFNKLFGNKYEKNVVVTVNDQNIIDEIKKFTEQGYTAATFFQDVKSKKEVDNNEIVAKTVTENFGGVNVLTNSKFVYIMR